MRKINKDMLVYKGTMRIAVSRGAVDAKVVTGVDVRNHAHHRIRHLASRQATVLPIEVVGFEGVGAGAAVVVVDVAMEAECWSSDDGAFVATLEINESSYLCIVYCIKTYSELDGLVVSVTVLFFTGVWFSL